MSATAKKSAAPQNNGATDLTLNVSQQQQARPARQQAADACVEYWNEVLAADGSFADECSALNKTEAGEK